MTLLDQRRLLERYRLLRDLEPRLAVCDARDAFALAADFLSVECGISIPIQSARRGAQRNGSDDDWLVALRGAQVPADDVEFGTFSLGLVEDYLAGTASFAEAGARIERDVFIGQTPGIRSLRAHVAAYARSEFPVLILGERGTGKGRLARAAHESQDGTPETFFSLSCSAVPETLAESELFGHRKGAFTGATANRNGLFATAFGCGGALYLDDVAEFASNVQPKILQAVEEGFFIPVGSDRAVSIRNGRRLKIYASSQPDSLHKLRPDLRDRLSTLVLAIPPLRERMPDILLLADHVVETFAQRYGTAKQLAQSGRALLLDYDWPGNVRQLQNVVGRALVRSGDARQVSADVLSECLREEERLQHLADDRADSTELSRDATVTLKEVQVRHIESALRRSNGNITRAAEMLGLTRTTLQSKLRSMRRAAL